MIKPVHYTKSFKKDWEALNHNEVTMVKNIVKLIFNESRLPKKLKDHQLKGDFINCRECHIKPDLLLIYKIEEEQLILVRIGSHSKLFK
jgi:mRNA interferase YafQ